MVAADKRLTKRADSVDDRRLDLGDLTQCLQRTQVVRNVLEQITHLERFRSLDALVAFGIVQHIVEIALIAVHTCEAVLDIRRVHMVNAASSSMRSLSMALMSLIWLGVIEL